MKKIITVMIALGATILAMITSAPNIVKASGDYIGLKGIVFDIIGTDTPSVDPFDYVASIIPDEYEELALTTNMYINDVKYTVDIIWNETDIDITNNVDLHATIYPSGTFNAILNGQKLSIGDEVIILAEPGVIEKVQFEVINKPKHGGGSVKVFSPNLYPLIEKYGEFETIGPSTLATNLIGLKYNSDRLNVNQESLHFNNVDAYQLYDSDSTIAIDDIYSNGTYTYTGNEINVGDTFELIFVNEQEIKTFEDYVDTENYTISFNSNEDSIGSDVYNLLWYLVQNDMIVSVSPTTIEISGYEPTDFNISSIWYDDASSIIIPYTNDSLDGSVYIYSDGTIVNNESDVTVDNIDITIQAKPFVIETVEFEVIDIDNGTITFSENTYNDIVTYAVLENNYIVPNLVNVTLNNITLDVILTVSSEDGVLLETSDTLEYYFINMNGSNIALVADLDLTIGDIWEMTFILPAYSITFESNGGSTVESLLVAENQVIEETPSNPTRSTYTFIGWYYDEELTQEFDINTPITEDMTLYAKWESNYRTISFVTNANRIKTPITILSGESLGYVPSAPSNRGYTFVGWYLDAELTQEFDINMVITEDMTLYAKWQLIDNDRIEFTHSATESWNGTVTPGTTEKLYGLLNKYNSFEIGMKLYWASLMIDGQVYLVNIEDTSHGLWIYYLYTFGNRPEYELYFWDDNMTYNEYGYHMIPYGDIVISYYPTHTVSFNTNGGTAINDMTVDRFDSFDQWLPTPSRSGYYFAGWYLDAELTKDFNDGDYIAEHTVERNITLYAKWVEDEEEIITEEKNEIIIITSGGTTYDPLIKYSNAGITVDEILDYVDGVERYGYVFMGWYLDAFHEIPLDTYDYFTQTTRIYAKWQRVTYTVTVNLNDGVVPGTSTTYTVDLNHGDTLAKLSTPIREGYTFVGWSISGYDTIYTGPIEESMNVVAVWKTSETESLQIKTEHIVYAVIIVGLLIILNQTSRKRRYR